MNPVALSDTVLPGKLFIDEVARDFFFRIAEAIYEDTRQEEGPESRPPMYEIWAIAIDDGAVQSCYSLALKYLSARSEFANTVEEALPGVMAEKAARKDPH